MVALSSSTMHAVASMILTILVIILAVLPWHIQAAPKPLYQVLGAAQDFSANAIEVAYQQARKSLLSVKTKEQDAALKLIEIEHAYEVLSNDLRRRDYDLFQIDELQSRIAEAKKQYANSPVESIPFPLWEPPPAGMKQLSTLCEPSFRVKMTKASCFLAVVQAYSNASPKSHKFVHIWNRAGVLLEGVAKLGRVELGETPLSFLLAERTQATTQRVFRHGLPEIVAFTPSCRHLGCLTRFRGEKTVDALVEWAATSLLKLPRILYYGAKGLMTDVIQKTGPHKVKVIVFSNTGERAAPYIRQAAKQYWDYAVFAMVLWQEQNSTFWETRVGVKSAPAVVFVKDPGLEPVIYHGHMNSSVFQQAMEKHKTFELPQLRSITAAELGCDASGYSKAGNDTNTWYCVVVAGRPGSELTQLRGVMRGVLHNLTSEDETNEASRPLLGAKAFREKRLSLAWLDGETQKDFCYFYLHSANMFEACGARRFGDIDVPKIFLVRYQHQNITVEEAIKEANKQRRARNLWAALQDDTENIASQLVSKYNGSEEVSEIVTWISQMVYEGDNENLPNFKGSMPRLVPEEKKPRWAEQTQEFLSAGREKLANGKQLLAAVTDYLKDLKMLPLLFFLILFFGAQFFIRSRNYTPLRQQARHHGEEVSQGEVQSLEKKKAPVPEKQFDQTDDSMNLEGLRRRKEGPT
ncbi:unnamed protein product [Sphagnum tenellum]